VNSFSHRPFRKIRSIKR